MNGKSDTAAAAPAPSLGAEIAHCWNELPNKAFFLGLLALWLLMFQFLGNSSLGYVSTPSLPMWMYNAYIHGDDKEEHGMLVPIVVLVLFWWKRKDLLSLPNRIWPAGLLLLALASVMHLAGYVAQQQRISIVAMFLGIYALMGIAWGPGWLRNSFFPFFLLLFCIPVASIAGPITFPMRMMVCKTVPALSDILGIDVVRDGTRLFSATHHYQYEVAAACSGIHSLVAILCLATVYGFITFPEKWKRILLIASAFPLAIMGNVARMMLIVVAAEISGQSGGDYVHESSIYSLVPYVPAIGGVLLLGHWLRERPAQLARRLRPEPA
jgi:exosortase